MRVDRRRFLAGLAAAPWLATLSGRSVQAANLVLNWPQRVLELPADQPDQKPPVVTAAAIHPEGRLLATAGDDHVVYLWNLTDGNVLQRLAAHTDWIHSLAFSPNGEALASAGTDRQVIFWEPNSAAKLQVFVSHEYPINQIAWSHDGRFMAGIGFEDKLRVYDVASQTLVRELVCPCHDMRAVAFSPDDTLLAVGGRNGTVRVWDATAGRLVGDHAAHRHRIRGLAFSLDGKFIVTSGEDRHVHVLHAATVSDGFDMPSCRAKVLSLAFYGPHHLATGCSDNVIRLWDLQARDEIGQLKGHTGSVATLTAHGRLLVSGSYDTTVRVWTISENVAQEIVTPLPPLRTSRVPGDKTE